MLVNTDVQLRALRLSDSTPLATLVNNKKIADNLRDVIPFPYTEYDAENFIYSLEDQTPVLTFAIEYEQKLCGVIGLVRQQDVYRLTAEISYWIGEPFWNKGIASKAVHLISTYGFTELNLMRIHAGIFEYNNASMRVLEKCGYEKDGIFKKSVIKNGVIWNEHRYSIVKK